MSDGPWSVTFCATLLDPSPLSALFSASLCLSPAVVQVMDLRFLAALTIKIGIRKYRSAYTTAHIT